ncbi:MAG: DUF4886 domain-containing protein [Clostridiales bacterium]|nr:DUF4886 domain-containing protein [Clostridiales bacterium]
MKSLRKILICILSAVLFLFPILTACEDDPPPKPDVTAQSLRLSGMKTSFAYGEEFSSEGLKVSVIYSDKTEKETEDFTVDSSKYNANTAGNHEITVNCEGLTRRYSVTVADPPKAEVALKSMKLSGARTTFAYGEQFSPAGLVVTAVYADDTEAVMAESEYELISSAYNKDASGEYDILVVRDRIVASYKVTVAAAPATGIRITGMKFKFGLDEEFSTEGLTVLTVYADNGTSPVESGYTVDSAAFKKGVAGRYQIFVHYGDYTGSYFATVGNPASEAWKEDNVLKILLIGHSYCEDSAEYLWEICNSLGLTAEVGLLWVGGSSMDQHYNWAKSNAKVWELKFKDRAQNGVWKITAGATFNETVTSNNWDFIMLTQNSFGSGRPSTFGNLDNYLNYVKSLVSENTQLGWLMPWSDMEGSQNAAFLSSGYATPMEMYTSITATMEEVMLPRAVTVVATGTAIQNTRTSYIGDGYQLNRDGHHLSWGLGRYIAALTAFETFTDYPLSNSLFAPAGVSDRQKQVVIESVRNAIENPFDITQSQYTE